MKYDWTKLQDLRVGDKVLAFRDGKLQEEEIVSIKLLGKEETYDIEVEGSHNFIANGLVTHNSEGTNRATAEIVMQEYVSRLRMIQQLIGENLETDLFAQLVEAKFGEGKEVPQLAWKPIWEPTWDAKAKAISELVQLSVILRSEARPQLGYPEQPSEEAIQAEKLLPAPRGPVKGLGAPTSEGETSYSEE
jgi:hypothetical protein